MNCQQEVLIFFFFLNIKVNLYFSILKQIDIENEIEQQNEELENILKNSIIAQEKAEIKEQLAAKLGLLTRKI